MSNLFSSFQGAYVPSNTSIFPIPHTVFGPYSPGPGTGASYPNEICQFSVVGTGSAVLIAMEPYGNNAGSYVGTGYGGGGWSISFSLSLYINYVSLTNRGTPLGTLSSTLGSSLTGGYEAKEFDCSTGDFQWFHYNATAGTITYTLVGTVGVAGGGTGSLWLQNTAIRATTIGGTA